MIIETNRLLLIPLNIEQLKLFVANRQEMAKSMGYYAEQLYLSKHTIFCLKKKIEFLEKNNNLLKILTSWQVVLKEEKVIIADITVNGMPYKDEIEIAYSTDKNYRNKGYMTEATKYYINWILKQDHYPINKVLALIESKNIPSKKVVKNVGMRNIKKRFNIELWGMSKL